jgi:hypothetical protein
MPGTFAGARRKLDRSGRLREMYNPRARLSGAICALGGLLILGSAAVAPDVAAVSAFSLLGMCVLGLSYRVLTAFSIAIAEPNVRLRSTFRTRTIPIDSVVDCKPDPSPSGLIYPAIALRLSLTNGASYSFNSIQWPPSKLDKAEDDCRAFTEAIRSVAE